MILNCSKKFFINKMINVCIKREGKDIKSNCAKKIGTSFACSENGAEDEIRTRDVHLGKVTLYH